MGFDQAAAKEAEAEVLQAELQEQAGSASDAGFTTLEDSKAQHLQDLELERARGNATEIWPGSSSGATS